MPTALIVILSVLGGLLLLLAAIASLRATVTLEYKEEVTVWLQVLWFRRRLLPAEKKEVDPRDYTPRKFRRMLKKKRKKELKKWQKYQLKKKKKAEKKAEKKAKKKAARQGTEQSSEPTRSLLDNLGFIKELLDDIPVRFLRHLRVKLSRIIVTVGSDDAAKTAIMYGAVSQSVAYIVEFLDHMSRLKYAPDAEVAVNADFLSEKSSADIKISFAIRAWHILDLIFSAFKIRYNSK